MRRNHAISGSSTKGLQEQPDQESWQRQHDVHFLRHYSTISAPVEAPFAKLPRYKVRRAAEYINDNVREDLTLAMVAKAVSMSPYHFAHVFKQATGLAPHRCVMERRIEQAKSLLRETDLPITEIANKVGYSNPSHFSVVFHRSTSVTPRQIQRRSMSSVGRPQ